MSGPRGRRTCALFGALTVLALAGGCLRGTEPQTDPHFAAEFREWAVACDHPLASAAGAEMLAAGGNAVDAAVAASFCLSVVRPFSCGIGGGGFMLISLPPTAGSPDSSGPSVGRAIALDYRETCPAAIGPDHFENLPAGSSELGAQAVAVPGTVAGLLHALADYGTLDRAAVMAPAIRAARIGYAADAAHLDAVKSMEEAWHRNTRLHAGLAAAWSRFAGKGRLRIGDLIVNEDQARALELIARDGAAAFYTGPIAEAILAAMNQGGGVLTREDLAGYAVREREPLRSSVGPWQVLSMPPPSSAGIAMQQVFGLLERWGGLAPGTDLDTAAWRHLLIEAFKHAFADRARWLADDGFVPVPTARLTSATYLDSLAARLDRDHTRESADYGSAPALPNDAGTSHISVLDGNGMAVSCTETINLHWGSCVEVPGFGFLLNDEMDDFTTTSAANAFDLVQSDRNRPAPGKRPLSSMSPAIVLRDGRPAAIAGASGGPRIISGTLQALLAALVGGQDAGPAVARPRLHHQWQPDEVKVEQGWTDQAVLDGLQARGHHLVDYANAVGVVQAIVVRDSVITAASDPRKGGRPAGR